MAIKPKIVTNISRQKETGKSDFSFSLGDIRVSNTNIDQYRKEAHKLFVSTPLPHTKLEAWRRTDLHKLNPGKFHILKNKDKITVPNEIIPFFETNNNSGTAVLTSGAQIVKTGSHLKQKGVVFTDLATAEKEYPTFLEKVLGKVVKPEEGKFSALSGAFAQTGLFLYIPKNVHVEEPFQSLFYTSGDHSALVTQIAIILEEGASATLIHEMTSPTDGQRKLHSGSIEIMVGNNANFKFVELQDWDNQVWNFTHERAQVGKFANLDWVVGAFGSNLTKNYLDLELIGEGASGKVSGFSFTNGSQHFDIDTQQNHRVPHTTSDLQFKSALTDQSRSVWQGMIYVAQGAEKTDGYQSSRNLILSSSARVDSIPGLEILADDVRCTHGATIGKIDTEQVFYLTSRGLSRTDAERLVIEGFFEPILQRIPLENIRNRFRLAIADKIDASN